MLFNSFLFFEFFAVVFLLHWLLPHRARTGLLLAASYLFYGSWNWRLLSLIAISTLLAWGCALWVQRAERPAARRAAVWTNTLGNLALLAGFKYYGFFLESLDLLLAPLGWSVRGLRLEILLPIGISFYTLQAIGYVVDVYRGRMRPVSNLPQVALFVCFFPQLVAGPIERAWHLLPQIAGPRRLRAAHLHEGALLAAWGLFKKVVVADNLALLVDPVYAPGASPTGLEFAVAVYAFTFQLYADFSAYTDIARGTARMLGFELMQNFRMPFFQRDMQAFWRHWHVSLSTWLRDYVYIPLGGNRVSEGRALRNLLLTMAVAGLWHGAGANFLLWGLLHGLLLGVTREVRRTRPPGEGSGWWGALLSFHLFALLLVPFRADSIGHAGALFESLEGGLGAGDAGFVPIALTVVLALPLLGFDALRRRSGDELFVLRWPLAARALVYFLVFQVMILFGRSDGLDFVYFQF